MHEAAKVLASMRLILTAATAHATMNPIAMERVMRALDCFAKHVGRVVKDLVGRHQVVLLVNTAGIHMAMVVGDDAVPTPFCRMMIELV